MGNSNVDLNKYEELISKRKERLKCLSNTIKMFEAESFLTGKCEGDNKTETKKSPIPAPDCHKFVCVPQRRLQSLKKPDKLETDSFSSPNREELPPQKGHVAHLVRKIEERSSQNDSPNKLEYRVTVLNHSYKHGTDGDNNSTHDRDGEPRGSEVVDSDISEFGTYEIDRESDVIESDVDCYGEMFESEQVTQQDTESDQKSPPKFELFKQKSNIYENTNTMEDQRSYPSFKFDGQLTKIFKTPQKDDFKESGSKLESRALPKIKSHSVAPTTVSISPDLVQFNMTDLPRMSTAVDSSIRPLFPTSIDLIRDLQQCSSRCLLQDTDPSESDLKQSLKEAETVLQQVCKVMETYSNSQDFLQSHLNAECHKLLLISKMRRSLILSELNRIGGKSKLNQRKIGLVGNSVPSPYQNLQMTDTCVGSNSKNPITFALKLTDLRLQLKRAFSYENSADECHYFVVTLQYGCKVLATELRSSVDFMGHGWVDFPEGFELSGLPTDFSVSLQVHYLSLAIPHQGVGKFLQKLANTPRKLLKRSKEKSSVSGKHFVSLSSEVLCARDNGKRAMNLVIVPSSCVLNGFVRMNLCCRIDSHVVIRCFLTFREDCWQRRWCLFSGGVLKVWKYPEEEREGRVPLKRVDLVKALCGRVRECEDCGRQFSMEVEMKEGSEVKRCLMATDSREEMVELMEYLNCLMSAIKLINN